MPLPLHAPGLTESSPCAGGVHRWGFAERFVLICFLVFLWQHCGWLSNYGPRGQTGGETFTGAEIVLIVLCFAAVHLSFWLNK